MYLKKIHKYSFKYAKVVINLKINKNIIKYKYKKL